MIVSELDQYDEQVPVANNGDACSHSERIATIQPLANRTRWFRNLLRGIGTTEAVTHAAATPGLVDILVPDGTIYGALNPWRRMAQHIRQNLRYWGDKITALEAKAHGQTNWEMFLPPNPSISQGDNWALFEGANLVTLIQQDTNNAQSAFIPIPQTNFGKPAAITSVQVLLRGSFHAALPATMPAISLIGQDLDFTADVLGTATDSSPDAATYNLQHYVNIPGLTPVQVGAYPLLMLKLTGEDDGGAGGGLQCLGIRVLISPT